MWGVCQKDFKKQYNFTIEEFEKNYPEYYIWDFLTEKEYLEQKTNHPYIERFKKLEKKISNAKDIKDIYVANYRIIKSDNFSKLINFYSEIIKKGGEGIIIKSPNIGYKNEKPSNIIKFKPETDIDLEIIGFEKANKNTKFEGLYNRIIAKSKEGKLITTIGGLKERDIKYLNENLDKLLGKIVTITGTNITKNKNKNTYSILHPRFKEFREDKKEADVIEKIKDIFDMEKLAKKILTNNNLKEKNILQI